MATDQLGGITYTFANVDAFLANTPSAIQYFGDLSEPSPFHDGATGRSTRSRTTTSASRRTSGRSAEVHAELRPALRLLHAAPRARQPHRQVQHRHRPARSGHDAVLQVEEDQLPAARRRRRGPPTTKTVLRGGFGIFVGPGQTEDQIQPIEAERISTTLSSGPLLLYPVDVAAHPRQLHRPTRTTAPTSRARTPTTTRCRRRSISTPRRCSRQLGRSTTLTVAYVGSQGRNLFLRSIANRTVGVLQTSPTATAANIREFDVVTCADGRVLDGRIAPLTPRRSAPARRRQQDVALRRDRLQDERWARQLQRAADRRSAAARVAACR